MGFYKKTILLKNNDANMGMGLLSIERTNSGVFATLKSYDIAERENMVLGLCVNGTAATKQNIMFANGDSYTFKLQNDFDIDGKIGAVLVDKSSKITPIVWGSSSAKSTYKDDIIRMFGDEDKTRAIPPKNEEGYEQTEVVAENVQVDSTALDKNAALFESTPEEIENLIDENMDEDGDFYSLIKDQIDDLFERFPRNAQLELVVDNSKWITIDFDGADKKYVLGLLYDDNGALEYIAYGVPGSADITPPNQIASYSQWLPLDSTQPDCEGYWIMFQNATTGDSVRINA